MNQGITLEHLIQLNDGPLDGIELVVDDENIRRVRSITIELAGKEDVDDGDDIELESVKYDLYLDEPTATDDGSVRCFYHQDSAILPKHPLKKFRHFLSDQDREYWRSWISDISHSLFCIHDHLNTDAQAKMAYDKARQRLDEVPNFGTRF